MSHILQTSRPQPVRLMAVVLAVLAFLTGAAGLGDLIPKVVMAWLIVIYGAVQVAWGAWTATQVTPLSAPQNASGVPLVPLPNATPPTNVGQPRPEGGYATNELLIILLVVVLVVLLLVWLL